MSTIAVAKRGGIAAIGADTLSTYGSQVERAEIYECDSKILTVGESLLAVVGSASWPLVLKSYFAQLPAPPALDSRDGIFEVFRALHRSLKEDYFLNAKEEEGDEFESSRLQCLIANPSGIFGMDALRYIQQFAMFYATGTGDQYALGAMRAVYPTAASAEDVVRAGLEAACYFDGNTGLPIEIHAVRLR